MPAPFRMVVPVDGSRQALTAIPLAARLAQGLGAEIVLLRVISPPRPLCLSTARAARAAASAAIRAQAQALVDVPLRCVVLMARRPADAMVGWLRRHPVDLIVMASHGRHGLQRLVVGSVTAAVLQSGLAPVVVVGPGSGAASTTPKPTGTGYETPSATANARRLSAQNADGMDAASSIAARSHSRALHRRY